MGKLVGVIDNDQIVLDSITIETNRLPDIKALTSQNAREAYQWIKNKVIDMLVADWQMPIQNGIDILEKVHEMDKEVPLFILTGHIETEELKSRAKKINARILNKSDGYENIIADLSDIRIEHPVGDMTLEGIELLKTKAFVHVLFEELIHSLEAIENKDDKIIISNSETKETKSLSVNELINNIKDMTPIGREYILLWHDTVNTLNRRKK